MSKVIDPHTPQYLYSAAVAQSWMYGTQLEKNLYNTFSQRICKEFIINLNQSIPATERNQMIDSWRAWHTYASNYITQLHRIYDDAVTNHFIQRALKLLCTTFQYNEEEMHPRVNN